MGFFNQNDFKYIIKRIIIILGVLIIVSMFHKVFGYTEWNAPNGRTYRIPDVDPMNNSKYVIWVTQPPNTNNYTVSMYHGFPQYAFVHGEGGLKGYLTFSKEPYSNGVWSGTFYAQIDSYTYPTTR